MIKNGHTYLLDLSDGNMKIFGHDKNGKILIIVISSQGDILSQRKI